MGITTDLKLVLHNDDATDMGTVLAAIMVVMGYDQVRAEQLMVLAHHRGQVCMKDGGDLDALIGAKEAFGRVGINVTLE